MPDLVVDRLSKEYPTRVEPLVVLRDVSVQLSRGDNLAVVGPSGCGKSTLLHVIGTLDYPTSGTVQLRGQNPFILSDVELARFRNKQVGFVFQDHHLLPQLSALENVLVPTLAAGSSTPAQADRARELLDRVGLNDRLSHRPAELSGGERQRVAIARALINRPTLLLADEPTGNLDQTNARTIGQLLLEIQRSTEPATMMIVVTHSQELADQMDRCLHLDEGRLKMTNNDIPNGERSP